MHGPLFYRQLEIDKVMALKASKGDFDVPLLLSVLSRSDLKWWSIHIHTTSNPVSQGNPHITIYSDASLNRRGGVINELSPGGPFSKEEMTFHINYLESLACFLTPQTFCSVLRDCHIKAMIDNTTVISYNNNMGGRTTTCNSVTRKLWLWCIERNFWVTAAHIPGKLDVLADTESRQIFHDTEWKLDRLVFDRISHFASRRNFQLRPFISWKPNPEAFAIDAFSISWKEHNFFAFPPFAIIDRVLQTTQTWFPRLLHMLVECHLLLPCYPQLLTLPTDPQKRYPLHNKLKLMACKLSGIHYEQEEFQKRLQQLSSTHGEKPLDSNTMSVSRSGTTFALKGVWIPAQFLP